MLKKSDFAKKHGFEDFNDMLSVSIIVFNNGITRWIITPTELGFLAWVDNHLDKPLGYFDTPELAKEEIIDVRNLEVLL